MKKDSRSPLECHFLKKQEKFTLLDMDTLNELFDHNKKWAAQKKEQDPDIFLKLSKKQTPKYLWIGCSDSRVPANEILGLKPGELFVHRNIANLFPHTDLNCLSVLQYAVEHLGVEHVIVCGHYGCGGVIAAMENAQLGLIDHWLHPIRELYEKEEVNKIPDAEERTKRLVELNVLHQVTNICQTTVVQNAWEQKQKLAIHGWIYDLSTGLLKDLNCSKP